MCFRCDMACASFSHPPPGASYKTGGRRINVASKGSCSSAVMGTELMGLITSLHSASRFGRLRDENFYRSILSWRFGRKYGSRVENRAIRSLMVVYGLKVVHFLPGRA